MSGSKNWYALYVKPNHEFKAEQQLTDLNIKNYLPAVTKTKRWSDRRKKVKEPVLRGYIFIFADEIERLKALDLKAVVKCIFDGGRPAVIPEWQILNLKKMLQIKTDFFLYDGLIPGSLVEILDGPFKGVKGIFRSGKEGKTLAVTINLLNRSVIAQLSSDNLVKVVDS